MSVEYSTGLYYGTKISNSLADEIRKKFPELYEDTYEEYFIWLNSWSSLSDMFLGYEISSYDVDTEYVIPLDMYTKLAEDESTINSTFLELIEFLKANGYEFELGFNIVNRVY